MKQFLLIIFFGSLSLFGQNGDLRIKMKDGTSVIFSLDNIRKLYFSSVTEVESVQGQVMSFRIFQNYPNPFNPSTVISYEIPGTENVKITVYDITGKLVKELADNVQSSGRHQVQWEGTNQNNEKVTSGIYIYTIKYGSVLLSKAMVLLK